MAYFFKIKSIERLSLLQKQSIILLTYFATSFYLFTIQSTNKSLNLHILTTIFVIESLITLGLLVKITKPISNVINFARTINEKGNISSFSTERDTDANELLSCIRYQFDERNELLERINRVNRTLDAIEAISQNINVAMNEKDIFDLLCQQLIGRTQLTMAWIGKEEKSTNQISPVASCGLGLSYLQSIRISTKADKPEGKGPTGTALRENQVVCVNDYQNSIITKPWQAQIKQYGWESACAFPITLDSQPFAVLTVYNPVKFSFNTEIVRLISIICYLASNRLASCINNAAQSTTTLLGN